MASILKVAFIIAVLGLTGAKGQLVEVPNQPWGLGSISSRTPAANSNVEHQKYTYDESAGTGTFAYLLDTGVRGSHPDFGGRVIQGHNVWAGYAFDDDSGHGTHVAGTIISSRFGVAKNATIIDVKTVRVVYTTVAKVIEALDWVAANVTNTPGRAGKSVISMSLGIGQTIALCLNVSRLTWK